MRVRYWIAATAAAVMLGATSMAVQAAPAGIAATDMKTTAREGTGVEPAHYYRRRHHRHRHYGLYFGAPYWGHYRRHYYHHHYAPGVRFYYGPRRHRHWHHRHYW